MTATGSPSVKINSWTEW